MNEILHSVSFLSAGAAGALFSAIWEGALLAACVYLGLRLLPGLSAAARSVVWLNVFILLVLMHFVPAIAGRSGAPGTNHISAVHLDLRWSLAVAAVWLALSLLRAVQLVLGIVHLRRLAGRAVPVPATPEIQALLADTPGRRPAELCTSDEVARPSVLGFFRPRVLIPPALVESLTPQELHQVVLHEMEHLRRADDWTNLAQKIGLVLFPLNPVLLWVERRLCAERELACDDRVVGSSAGRKAYALCLTRLAEFSLLRRSFSLVLGAWERRPELVRRVHRILRQPVRSMGRTPALVATGSLLAGALGCAVVLSQSPQLVSFVPSHENLRQAYAPLDPNAVARALGGTPRLMKATVPSPALQSAQGQKARRRPVQPAILKSVRRHEPAPGRVAIANQAPAAKPLPVVDRRALVVLTEFTTYQAQPQVVLAVSRDRLAAQAVPIRATFAIVPIPNGWLIIQI